VHEQRHPLCAGSPLALLLAKRGRTVLVVDKDHVPSDQVHSTLVQSAEIRVR
jgi:flavin-dependent dehydrogenase